MKNGDNMFMSNYGSSQNLTPNFEGQGTFFERKNIPELMKNKDQLIHL